MFTTEDSDNSAGFLFSDGYLAHFDTKSKLKIILDLINDTSEEDVFGEVVVRWRITDEGRELIRSLSVEAYKDRYDKTSIDESDEKGIYRMIVARYLDVCLCHEEFIMKSDNSQDIRRIGLKNLAESQNIELLYGIGRIHENGIATYIGFDPNNLYPNDDDKKGQFLITTEKEVMEVMSHCTVIVTPEVKGHRTIYFVNLNHLIPTDLPEGYEVSTR